MVSQACPLFVPLVENGYFKHDATYLIAKEYLQPLKDADVDTIIMGCTHYPLLKDTIYDIMDGKVELIDPGYEASLSLKKYLEEAGAKVIISRTKDTTIALADRSILANNSGAEIFVSIHHNAPGKTEDDYTNYTSSYYHAKETDYEYEPCNHNIARYIERDLSYVMRNSGGLGSFDGTYSDYNIYHQ